MILAGCAAAAPGTSARATGSAQAARPSPQPTAATAGALCTTAQNPYPARLAGAGDYSIEPDKWNASGSVCLSTSGGTGFTVSAVRAMKPRTQGSPGAYANIATAPDALGLPVPVRALGDATSDWSASSASSGSYDMAYDLWYGPSASNCEPGQSAELMIWLDATDNVDPAGSRVGGPVTLGNASYDVYQAPIASEHTVISYVRTEPTHTADRLDLRLFTEDALLRGYVPQSSYLCKVSAGFEIWNGGVGLRTWSFSYDNVVGLPSGAVSSGAPGICLVRPSGAASTAAPVTGPCGGAGSTTWILSNNGALMTQGLCLQRSAGSGSAVALQKCTGQAAQRWSPGPDGRLVNAQSGSCLDTAGGSLAVGVAAELRPCGGGASQRWQLPYNGRG